MLTVAESNGWAMPNLLDPNWIILAQVRVAGGRPAAQSLKAGYLAALGTAYDLPSGFPDVAEDARTLTVENSFAKAVVARLMPQWRPADKPSLTEADLLILHREALALLDGERPNFAAAFHQLVSFVIYDTSGHGALGGASFGQCISVIFVRPGRYWRAEDLAECLLHESVHQAMFLADLWPGLFTDAAFETELRLPSAVRTIYPSKQDRLRPFIPSVHAAVVAAELIQFFERRGRTEKADAFRVALHSSVPALLEHKELFTDAGCALLRAAA